MGNVIDRDHIIKILNDLKKNAKKYADNGKISMVERHHEWPGYHVYHILTKKYGEIAIYSSQSRIFLINNISVSSHLYNENELNDIWGRVDDLWKEYQKKLDLSKPFFNSSDYEDWHIEKILTEILKKLDKYKPGQCARSGLIHSGSTLHYYEVYLDDLGLIYLTEKGTIYVNGVYVKKDFYAYPLFKEVITKIKG
jgi:hypothetical protein